MDEYATVESVEPLSTTGIKKAKQDRPKQRQDKTFYNVFDFELIQCAKEKTEVEFDLGDTRIRGVVISVDRYMVKVNTSTDPTSPMFKWIGKHHIVVCTPGTPKAVTN